MEIGKFNTLRADRKVGIGYYLSDEKGNDVLLPAKWVPASLEEGDLLEVFLYLDNDERPIATTLQPKATLGDFACLKVREVSPYGAFLDWGIQKDLFVPFAEQAVKMQQGQTYLVYVYMDEMTQRVVASSRVEYYAEKEEIGLKAGQEVDLLIGRRSELGYQVIINNKYLGLLYTSEVFKPLETGQREKGFVRNVREDLKIDVSLQRQGYAGIEPNARKIMQVLEKNRGFLPLHDKSDPEEIKRKLEMSKKTFKKAIGSLYKEQLIDIGEDGIRLA